MRNTDILILANQANIMRALMSLVTDDSVLELLTFGYKRTIEFAASGGSEEAADEQ